MTSWFKKKCPCCRKKTPKDKLTAEIRVGCEDGFASLIVCDECARFWDKSAVVLQRRGRPIEDEDEDEDDEY